MQQVRGWGEWSVRLLRTRLLLPHPGPRPPYWTGGYPRTAVPPAGQRNTAGGSRHAAVLGVHAN